MFGRLESSDTVYLLFYISFLVELSRILLGSYISQPSDELQETLQERINIHQELSNIKSVQLQLVQHSKLTRKDIVLEKKIAKLRENQSNGLTRLKHVFIFIRVIIYGILCFLYGFQPFIVMTGRYFPILSYFLSPNGTIFFMRGWFVLFMIASAVRYALRRIVFLIPSWRDQIF